MRHEPLGSQPAVHLGTPGVEAPARARRYERHKPEETVLYGLVREHLETFLAHARAAYAKDLPRYVERELRSYLDCGRLERGF